MIIIELYNKILSLILQILTYFGIDTERAPGIIEPTDPETEEA